MQTYETQLRALEEEAGGMIWDSAPWKDALRRDAARLAEISAGFDDREEDVVEAILAEYERLAFLSAFSIRKLIEANKVSDQARAKTVRVEKIGKNGQRFSLFNDTDLSRYYDVKTLKRSNLSLERFLNVIIHSHVFAPIMNEQRIGLWGFFVTSDQTKESVLFRVEIKMLIETMTLIADDHITESQVRSNHEGKTKIILTNDALVKRK